MRKFTAFVFALVALMGCTTDEQRFNREIAEIEDYIASTGLEFTATGTGLYYHTDIQGNLNRIPDSSNNVSFKHVGYLLDSTIFSSGWYASDHISMAYLVNGFQQGLQAIGEGGRGVIVFPSELGYGKAGASTVPKYSPLVFKVELVSYY
jgi:FKBP-type peptidyl-prolyl cis-trans isomerase FkpA